MDLPNSGHIDQDDLFLPPDEDLAEFSYFADEIAAMNADASYVDSDPVWTGFDDVELSVFDALFDPNDNLFLANDLANDSAAIFEFINLPTNDITEDTGVQADDIPQEDPVQSIEARPALATSSSTAPALPEMRLKLTTCNTTDTTSSPVKKEEVTPDTSVSPQRSPTMDASISKKAPLKRSRSTNDTPEMAELSKRHRMNTVLNGEGLTQPYDQGNGAPDSVEAAHRGLIGEETTAHEYPTLSEPHKTSGNVHPINQPGSQVPSQMLPGYVGVSPRMYVQKEQSPSLEGASELERQQYFQLCRNIVTQAEQRNKSALSHSRTQQEDNHPNRGNNEQGGSANARTGLQQPQTRPQDLMGLQNDVLNPHQPEKGDISPPTAQEAEQRQESEHYNPHMLPQSNFQPPMLMNFRPPQQPQTHHSQDSQWTVPPQYHGRPPPSINPREPQNNVRTDQRIPYPHPQYIPQTPYHQVEFSDPGHHQQSQTDSNTWPGPNGPYSAIPSWPHAHQHPQQHFPSPHGQMQFAPPGHPAGHHNHGSFPPHLPPLPHGQPQHGDPSHPDPSVSVYQGPVPLLCWGQNVQYGPPPQQVQQISFGPVFNGLPQHNPQWEPKRIRWDNTLQKNYKHK